MSRKARERARVLAGGYRDNINGGQATPLKVCYDLLTQEKAKQDEEHRLVHEDKEDLADELQALKQRRRSRGMRWKLRNR